MWFMAIFWSWKPNFSDSGVSIFVLCCPVVSTCTKWLGSIISFPLVRLLSASMFASIGTNSLG